MQFAAKVKSFANRNEGIYEQYAQGRESCFVCRLDYGFMGEGG